MATYWENSCSFGLRYVSWYKYLIVSLVFSHLGFWSGNLFLIASFPDLCLLVPSQSALKSFLRTSGNIKFSRGRSPVPPLTRGGNAPSRALPLHVPSALVNVFDLSWPDHFSKADDGPGHSFCSTSLALLNKLIIEKIETYKYQLLQESLCFKLT